MRTCLTILAAVALSAAAAAQTRPDPAVPPAPERAAAMNSSAPARGTELLGKPLLDSTGETLGKVAEVAIAGSGEISVVIERAKGGFICMPLSCLRVELRDASDKQAEDPAHVAPTAVVERFIFPGAPDQLLSAEAMVTAQSVDFEALQASREHFLGPASRPTDERGPATDPGVTPSGKPDEKPPGPPATIKPLCLTKLVGQIVQDVVGEKIGDVKDLAVDIGTSQVAYVVITTSGIVGIKLQGVPLEKFQLAADGKALRLPMTADALKTAGTGLDLDRLPMRASKLGDTAEEPHGAKS
jgi:sporulation protein YlmC with PRC-barrel domain